VQESNSRPEKTAIGSAFAGSSKTGLAEDTGALQDALTDIRWDQW
jgi:hypothetical protein